MTGTGLGQLIALLLSPVVTHIFDPDYFTTLEQFAMLLAIGTVFSTGKYELAIVQAKDHEGARHLVVLALRIALVLTCVLLPLTFIFNDEVANLYNNPDLGTWLWLVPVGILFFSVQNTLNFWFTRKKQFKTSAKSKVAFSFVNEPTKIGTGLAGWFSGGLVISVVFARLVSAAYLLRQFLKDEAKGLGQLVRGRMKEMAVEFKNYPRYTILSSLMGRLAQWSHIFLFSVYFGPYAIGFFALSRRIFMNPLNTLSASYAPVFYQRISEMEDPRELKRFYFSNLAKFSGIAVILVLFVQLLPDATMGVIFGEKWAPALGFLKLLSFWYALNFITSSLSFINFRLKKQKAMLWLDAFHLFIVVGSIIFAYKSGWNEMETVFALVIAKVVFFCLNIFASIFFVVKHAQQLTK